MIDPSAGQRASEIRKLNTDSVALSPRKIIIITTKTNTSKDRHWMIWRRIREKRNNWLASIEDLKILLQSIENELDRFIIHDWTEWERKELFHLLIIDGLIFPFGVGRQSLDLFMFIWHRFREDQVFPLIVCIFSFVNDMIVLTWNGLKNTEIHFTVKRRFHWILFWIVKPKVDVWMIECFIDRHSFIRVDN